MRQAWFLGGGLRPDELDKLTISDRELLLEALDWFIEQENETIEAAKLDGKRHH